MGSHTYIHTQTIIGNMKGVDGRCKRGPYVLRSDSKRALDGRQESFYTRSLLGWLRLGWLRIP